ncbi:MAG: HlyD family efflux transporter periplasmic adaptor subunit [Candidatus Moranbacteria bacterium]|nr:HlyD family efflux transporter periplasmic adaptor subunit [Candidatus Moranbacteria bacterium]
MANSSKKKKRNKEDQLFFSILIILIGVFFSLLLFIYINQERRVKLSNELNEDEERREEYILSSELVSDTMNFKGRIRGSVEVDLISGAEGYLFELAVDEGKKIYKGQYLFRLSADESGKINQQSYIGNKKLLADGREQDLYFFKQFEALGNRVSILKEMINNLGSMEEIDYAYQGRGDFLVYEINKEREIIKRSQKAGQRIVIEKQLVSNWVRSPIQGIVTNTSFSPGSKINLGDRIMTVSDPSTLVVEASIDRDFYDNISYGLAAKALLENGVREFALSVIGIETEEEIRRKDQFQVQFSIDSELNQAELAQLLDKKVDIEIEMLAKPIYRVPNDFILNDKNGTYVFIDDKKISARILKEDENQSRIDFEGIKDGLRIQKVQ